MFIKTNSNQKVKEICWNTVWVLKTGENWEVILAVPRRFEMLLCIVFFLTKQRLKLCKILENSGPHVPNTMMNSLEYIITLPTSNDLLLTQANQAAGTYLLKNLELEYKTITNDQLAEEISSCFSAGKSIPYENVTIFQKISWPKAIAIQNIVNVPRKSMKAIILLFKDNSTDPESFFYPNIK